MARFKRKSTHYVVTGRLFVRSEPRVAWSYSTLERALRAASNDFVPGSEPKIERIEKFVLVGKRS